MLYFTFVYPQLLYGVEVYANACKSHLEKLTVLNNKLLRIAQNCPVRNTTNMYSDVHLFANLGLSRQLGKPI